MKMIVKRLHLGGIFINHEELMNECINRIENKKKAKKLYNEIIKKFTL